MVTEKSQRISTFISVSKDLIALSRDAALFVLAALLIVFPQQFNEILTNAGFVEGSFIGLKWKARLQASDNSLQMAHGTITDLQKKNDELVKTLADANAKLADPAFKERFVKLEHANNQLKATVQQVQSDVVHTIDTNRPFIKNAQSSISTATSAPLKSDYLVALQTLGMSDDVRINLNAKLHEAGYGLHETSSSYPGPERPSFFAQRSTVFYYAPSALPAAKELARLLKQITGDDFAVQRGSGLGVNPSQQDVTLFVHYIKG
ncbi:hypothetical protein WK57_04475 [Burkholderia ubonensis]|uniref:Uncharacterized protein n=1 Tax=Burkholderia ubonensis TaxID=101571 RepID=A0AA40UXT9_9BURK|nr:MULTISPECIES: hypothetical protein [Burkholderia]KIP18798.1 hypothetical protein KY49_2856 [Burkholderia sp. MSHR3999]KVU22691.1 hypothetical protein WK64_29410 [Burkholderia ubonensis]KWZ59904.1 hypothetical protein WK57_04475 [Burkholderia ubonensis]